MNFPGPVTVEAAGFKFGMRIKKGALLRVRVRPPSGGFNTLTFASVKKHERKNLPPKEDDVRVQKLILPEKPQEKPDLEEFTFDESAVDVL